MATLHWRPSAAETAQVATVTVSAGDATTTYTLTVGGISVSTTGSAVVATIATNLATAWNASTHPYLTGITATTNSADVILTAAVSGLPFAVTSSESGGAGTIDDPVATTAATGKQFFSDGDNWFDHSAGTYGTAPAASDTIVFADTDVSCLWDLDQNTIDLTDIFIFPTFTGKLGLNPSVFVTCPDGESWDDCACEYRQPRLKIGWTDAFINIGGVTATAPGSGRVMLDSDTTSAETAIYGAGVSSDDGWPSIDIAGVNSGSQVNIINAAGGVGIANRIYNEAATFASINIGQYAGTSPVIIGGNVTLAAIRQWSGALECWSAITTAYWCNGGTAKFEGRNAVEGMAIKGGTVYPNNEAASGSDVGEIQMIGGTIDATDHMRTRVWKLVDKGGGGAIKFDRMPIADGLPVDQLTITTLDERGNPDES